MRGIRFNKQHSWYTFHAVISSSEKPIPAKRLVEERVPYSNVSYDFSCLTGEQIYEDRILNYVLTFTAPTRKALLRKKDAIVNWLYEPVQRIALYDDEEPGYHYLAKCTGIESPEITGCVCRLAVTFTAYPLRLPDRSSVIYTTVTAPYPDVNLDGTVDSSDAALILQAAADIGAGEETGLTAEQLDRADANRDGTINSDDAVLVQEFAANVGSGSYTDTPKGWVAFLNDRVAKKEGKI